MVIKTSPNIKLLHFADAHIDLARQGRRDAESGLPLRVVDFLNSLDVIINSAVDERVDLVIFSGDAYRDRSPAPTYQREWGERMMQLSNAGIETVLILGNHDITPAAGRAHTLQEFETLQVPHIHVASRPGLLGPNHLNGLPVQVIAVPWVNRSGLAAALEDQEDVSKELGEQLINIVESLMNDLDPSLPAILAGHLSVQGAIYGNERSVMLGRDVVLPPSLMKDERLDYVALGHIHKAQNLNEGGHHPVIYPGSIERVDFGEVNDRKTYVVAQVSRNNTVFEQRDLPGRKFIDLAVDIENHKDMQEKIMQSLPDPYDLESAIVRLVVAYPRDLESLIDEPEIRRAAESAFEFHFVRRPKIRARLRLPGGKSAASMPPLELLELYWKTVSPDSADTDKLNELAGEIICSVESGGLPQAAGEGSQE